MRMGLPVVLALLVALAGASSCSAAHGAATPQGREATGAGRIMLDFYRTHSVWTDPGNQKGLFEGIRADTRSIVEAVQGVMIHGGLAWLYDLKPSPAQTGGEQIRKTEELLQRIAGLEGAPLAVRRPPEKRLLVNCREFAVLTCSIFRHKGIPARARAGYAVYTWGRGKYDNHWICEYWNQKERRWVQVDAQIDDKQRDLTHVDFDTLDLPGGKFVTAGDGWQRYRRRELKPELFGVAGEGRWIAMGWPMVMPNVTCDVMALNKMELLPWDVNPYWNKKEAEMSSADMAVIDWAAELSVAIDRKWIEMRQFFKAHPNLCVTKDVVEKDLGPHPERGDPTEKYGLPPSRVHKWASSLCVTSAFNLSRLAT